MGKHLWVEEDQFAAAFSEILGDIADGADEAVFHCVHDALVEGRDEWRAGGVGLKEWDYVKHVTYRTLRKKGSVEGHIFSRKPGLPHLLEKGHAKSGGGRTRAFEHVKPAANLAFAYVRAHLPEYIAMELR